MEIENLIKEFKNYLKDLKYTKSTLTGYSLDVLNFFKWQENSKVKKIPEFIKYLEQQNFNAKTINHHIFALKHFENFLSKKKLSSFKIQGLSLELLIPINEVIQADLNYQHIENFIEKIKKIGNKRYIALALLMSHTGIKISEALEIKLEHFSGSKVLIKNEERSLIRSVRANKEVMEAINSYLKSRKGDSPYLFNSNKSEKLDRTVVNRFFKEYEITPKTLREYFIVKSLLSNVKSENISKKAGIKTINWFISRYEEIYLNDSE